MVMVSYSSLPVHFHSIRLCSRPRWQPWVQSYFDSGSLSARTPVRRGRGSLCLKEGSAGVERPTSLPYRYTCGPALVRHRSRVGVRCKIVVKAGECNIPSLAGQVKSSRGCTFSDGSTETHPINCIFFLPLSLLPIPLLYIPIRLNNCIIEQIYIA